MALVVWNGIVPSAPEHYVYAHEIAHVVDGDPREERLSRSNRWLSLWNREKNRLTKKLLDPYRRERVLRNPVEGFATLLATAWIEPRYLYGHEVLTYFQENGLLAF